MAAPGLVLGFAATAAFSATATVGLYPDEAQRIVAADAVNATPAIVALYGPVYDPTSLGELAMFKLTALGAAMVSILMVVLVVRHTRAEEEAGRLELVGAGVVGRGAPLAAALVTVFGACVALGLLTSAGLAAAGLPAAGSVAFGAAWAMTGACFAAVAGVTAQVTVGGRAAIGLGLVGDRGGVRRSAPSVTWPTGSPGWTSWLSPIGWNQQVRAFAGDRWAVLASRSSRARAGAGSRSAAQSAGPGRWLARRPARAGGRRDLRQPGVSPGGCSAPRSPRGRWASACSALVLGSIAHSVSGFLDSPSVTKILEQLGGAQGLTDAFLAAEMGLIGAIVSAYGITPRSGCARRRPSGTPRWCWPLTVSSSAVGGEPLGAGHGRGRVAACWWPALRQGRRTRWRSATARRSAG